MALDLIIGPAHAGKIGDLYARYLAALETGERASLVVPDQATRGTTQRELVARAPGILGADVVTFDMLFERILLAVGDRRPLVRGGARRALLRRALPDAGDAFATRLNRLGSALLDPAAVRAAGDVRLADAYATWWRALDGIGAIDRGRMRCAAIAALHADVSAWPAGQLLFAQGFDDLSPAQEALLDAVAQRAGVVASLPYEAGRAPFAVLRDAVERLAERAGPGHVVERRAEAFDRHPDLVALERRFGDPQPPVGPPTGDGIGTAEVEGERGEAEVVVHELAAALRAGTPGRRIAVIAPRGAAGRRRLVRQIEEAGIAVAADDACVLPSTPFGRALLLLLQLAWAEAPSDDDRLDWLRTPWSGAPPRMVEWVERPIRRSRCGLDAALEENAERAEPLRRALALPAGLRAGGAPAVEAAAAVRAMLQRAHGLEAPRADADLRLDVQVAAAALEQLDALAAIDATQAEVREALRRLPVRLRRTHEDAVRILDARDARTADLDVAIVVGLEDPTFGAGTEADPLVAGPEPADVARHLAYAAITRPRGRLVLVRRVADDDGSPLAATAIWEDLMIAAGDPPILHRRRFSDAVYPLEAAPTVRERARSIAHEAARDRAGALRRASEAGVSGAIRRALASTRRGTALHDPRVLEALQRDIVNVTEVDRFGDCSHIWFAERRLQPKDIDVPVDDRLAAGILAHKVLARFYREVPALLRTTAIGAQHVDRALVEMQRIVDEEVGRLTPVRPGDRRAIAVMAWRLRRELGRLVQRAARAEAPLVPSEFEVSFGGRGAQAGRKGGLDVGPAAVSGKIDRIDLDPAFTARALVVDYKTSTISTGREIRQQHRLQIPLYLLALREVLGREPVGGLLVSIRKGEARGLIDADEDDVLPPHIPREDLLRHDEFEAALAEARAEAGRRIERMQAGDVRHDPRDEARLCRGYCQYRGICRVAR